MFVMYFQMIYFFSGRCLLSFFITINIFFLLPQFFFNSKIGMQPEEDDGNVEYKLKLLDTSESRIEKLASQMRYRCNEGSGECFYNLGVEDDGTMTGLTAAEYESTIRCLTKAASINSYSISVLSSNHVETDRRIYELHIREINDTKKYIDLTIAIAGSVDCGKSTFLSVLTCGRADNGRGSARLAVFNFPHEVESGRTSSIGHQIVGYDNNGIVMNFKANKIFSWPEIVQKSSKVVTFFDLAGHEKYLKTTILGLTSARPEMSFIMIGANRGILRMTIEHIFLCKTLSIPFAIVITKLDLMKDRDNVLNETLESIQTFLKKPGLRRIPIKIKSDEDVIRCAMNIHSESIVPIFSVSNVSLQGIADVHKFLNLIPQRVLNDQKQHFECHLDTAWMVTGVGTVVGGHLLSGSIKVGDKLFFGPNQNHFTTVVVRSIHCKKVPVQQVCTQCYICVALRGISKQDFKRGNVLLGSVSQQHLCSHLTVDVEILKTHSTTIKVGYQPIMHVQNIRTSVTIKKISNKICGRASQAHNDDILRTGDSAQLYLEICFEKKFVKKNANILLCEGRTKVVGTVIETYDISQVAP